MCAGLIVVTFSQHTTLGAELLPETFAIVFRLRRFKRVFENIGHFYQFDLEDSMKLDITPEERDDLVRGLQIRLNIIETGDPALRANDAINMGKPKLVKALSADQRALVARTEALVTKLLVAR